MCGKATEIPFYIDRMKYEKRFGISCGACGYFTNVEYRERTREKI